MAATACQINLKPRRALDHFSTWFSDRTAQLTSFIERLEATLGITIPTHLNIKIILDAVQGKIGWTQQQDTETMLQPLNDALAEAAIRNNAEFEDFRYGVSQYMRMIHAKERIQYLITAGRGTKKLFTEAGLDLRNKISNLRRMYGEDAGIVAPEVNEQRLEQILSYIDDFFDPANEAKYFARNPRDPARFLYKSAVDYEQMTLEDIEVNLEVTDPTYQQFYEDNIDMFDTIRETMNQRRVESEYNGPIKEFIRKSYGWRHYVPFKSMQPESKLEEYTDDYDIFESTGYLNDTETDAFKGRTTKAADPYQQLQLDLLRSGKTLHDSLVARTLYDLVQEHGDITGVTISKAFNTTTLPNAKGAGERPKGAKANQPGRISRAANTIIVHKGDSAYVLEMRDRDLFTGLKNYWASTNELANNVYKYTLKPLGALKTKYNAPWAFYTNFIREFRNQLIYGTLELGYDDNGKFSFDISRDYLKNVLQFGGFKDALNYHTRDYLGKLQLEADGSVYAKWANKLVSLGGESTFLQALDISDIQQKMEDAYVDAIGGPPRNRDALKSKIRRLDEKYEGLINGVDLSTRVALFKAIVENGKMDEQAAAIYVKNLMNFNYRGKVGDTLRMMYIFYSPSAAGVFRMLHTFIRAKNPAQTYALMAWYTASVGFAYMLTNMALGEDDDGEDYAKKIDDFTLIKNSVLPVIGDNGSATIIPRALGLETLIAAPGLLAARYLLGHTNLTKASVAMTKTLLDNSTFVSPADPGSNVDAESVMTAIGMTLVPSLARPLLETKFNTTSQGLQIHNPYIDPDTPKYLQARDNTDELYKLMSEFTYDWTGGKFDFSPESIKHNFMQYLGAIATTTNRFMTWNDKVMRGDPMTATDVPFMPTMSTKDIIYYPQRMFADARQEWRLGKKALKVSTDENEPIDPLDALAKNLDYQTRKIDRQINKQIKSLRESNLSEQEQADRIRMLLEHRNLIRQQLVVQWRLERDSE